ncbi:hypothetical protein YPPY61_3559, partial [Yersinia pestis PY-61]
MNPDKL